MEKGILLAEHGNWNMLMEEIYGRHGLLGSAYVPGELLSDKTDKLSSEDRFELKKQTDLKNTLQGLITNPEPQNYLDTFCLHHSTTVHLSKKESKITAQLESKDIEEILKVVSVPFLLAEYVISFKRN